MMLREAYVFLLHKVAVMATALYMYDEWAGPRLQMHAVRWSECNWFTWCVTIILEDAYSLFARLFNVDVAVLVVLMICLYLTAQPSRRLVIVHIYTCVILYYTLDIVRRYWEQGIGRYERGVSWWSILLLLQTIRDVYDSSQRYNAASIRPKVKVAVGQPWMTTVYLMMGTANYTPAFFLMYRISPPMTLMIYLGCLESVWYIRWLIVYPVMVVVMMMKLYSHGRYISINYYHIFDDGKHLGFFLFDSAVAVLVFGNDISVLPEAQAFVSQPVEPIIGHAPPDRPLRTRVANAGLDWIKGLNPAQFQDLYRHLHPEANLAPSLDYTSESCVVCLSEKPVVRFSPCCHTVMCKDCLTTYERMNPILKCPLCHNPVLEYSIKKIQIPIEDIVIHQPIEIDDHDHTHTD